MCLYPRLIKNRKYTANKKNGGNIPAVTDKRTLAVPRKCGKCKECCKAKSREWQVRIQEHIKTHTNGKFITLTLSNESFTELKNKSINNTYKEILKILQSKLPEQEKTIKYIKEKEKTYGYKLDNQIITLAVRYFLERWRKKFKKSTQHWLISELGHKGTENVHMHGIIWTDESYDTIEKMWQYGYIWPRRIYKYGKYIREHTYVNNKTINYTVKYINKIDKDHKYYRPKMLVSDGIGINYTQTINSKNNKYKNKETDETYKTNSGHKISLPIYWRNKIYNEEEREKLWINKLDNQKRYINGIEIDISKTEKKYYQILKQAQIDNEKLGYGNDKINWKEKDYEEQRRIFMHEKRSK